MRDCRYERDVGEEKVLEGIANWDTRGLPIHVPFSRENIHIFYHIFKRV